MNVHLFFAFLASAAAAAQTPANPGQQVSSTQPAGVRRGAGDPDGLDKCARGAVCIFPPPALVALPAVKLFNVNDGAVLRTFTHHTDYFVLCLAIMPDGRRFISGSHDFTTRIAEIATGYLTLT